MRVSLQQYCTPCPGVMLVVLQPSLSSGQFACPTTVLSSLGTVMLEGLLQRMQAASVFELHNAAQRGPTQCCYRQIRYCNVILTINPCAQTTTLARAYAAGSPHLH
jgi:hypothetical protein